MNSVSFSPSAGKPSFVQHVRASHRIGRLMAALISGMLAAGSVSAAVVGHINTGTGTSGLLPAGSLDAHYRLTSSSDPSVPGPSLYVVAPPGGPFGFPLDAHWVRDGIDSQWIVPYLNGAITGGTVTGPGTYIYSTTFDLGGFDPGSALISGRWAVDEAGVTIKLNGIAMGGATSAQGYGGYTPFTLDHGFVAGINTLEFVTTNIGQRFGNPIGLRVEGDVMALAAVPEPATHVMTIVGLACMLMARRRRRSSLT